MPVNFERFAARAASSSRADMLDVCTPLLGNLSARVVQRLQLKVLQRTCEKAFVAMFKDSVTINLAQIGAPKVACRA